MNKKILSFFCLSICLSITGALAQKPGISFFNKKAVSLLLQFNRIEPLQGSAKQSAEINFRDSLMAVLEIEGSFDYTFDTLKNVGRIQSDDKKLNIFSWNIPEKSGYSKYFCVLQYYSKKEKQLSVFPLTEAPGMLKKAPQAIADVKHWPGALYYDIITTKYKGQVFYTLLGFNFSDALTNIKIIDILNFNEQDFPVFPTKMFLYNGKPQNRIVYEYNERAQMMLEYNPSLKLIVADHLSPARPSLEGQYQFYGPDFSYEGFSFDDGIWIQKDNVDVRN